MHWDNSVAVSDAAGATVGATCESFNIPNQALLACVREKEAHK